MADEPPQANSEAPGAQRAITWETIFFAVWLYKKYIALFVGAATLVAIIFSLLATPLYTSRTSILPELSKEKALGLAGLSSLAEATGIGLGEAPISRLYPMIVRSERILRPVIYHKYSTKKHTEPADLAEYWGITSDNKNREFESGLSKLRRRMDIVYDARLGTISIEIRMEEPQLAADVANQIAAELDDYTRTKRRTNATLQREFIEQRMKEVEEQLGRSEMALKEFRERNRRIIDSPQLMLEQERLAREVQINSTVFIELKKQLEVAKIEEIKNIPIINVLDVARPAVVRSSPKRARTAVVTLLLSLALAVTVAGFVDHGSKAIRTLLSNLRDHPPPSAAKPLAKVEEKEKA